MPAARHELAEEPGLTQTQSYSHCCNMDEIHTKIFPSLQPLKLKLCNIQLTFGGNKKKIVKLPNSSNLK